MIGVVIVQYNLNILKLLVTIVVWAMDCSQILVQYYFYFYVFRSLSIDEII